MNHLDSVATAASGEGPVGCKLYHCKPVLQPASWMLQIVLGCCGRSLGSIQDFRTYKWSNGHCLALMARIISIACDRLVPENRQTEGSKDRKQRQPEDLALKCNRPTQEAHKLLSLLRCVNVKEHRIVLYMFIRNYPFWWKKWTASYWIH